jgi:hypothetical protein
MPSDIEFLRQRLALVARELAQPNEIQRQRQGSICHSDLVHREIANRREARLLQMLLARAWPGSVLHMLTAWRQTLGQVARNHRTEHKEAIRAYDEWSELPRHVRVRVTAPPKPLTPRYFDYNGAPWIVDDGLLVVVDDLIERLQKWLEEDTEI